MKHVQKTNYYTGNQTKNVLILFKLIENKRIQNIMKRLNAIHNFELTPQQGKIVRF